MQKYDIINEIEKLLYNLDKTTLEAVLLVAQRLTKKKNNYCNQRTYVL